MTLSLTSGRAAVFRSCAGAAALPTSRKPGLNDPIWTTRAAAIDAQIATQTLPFWYADAFEPAAAGFRMGFDAVNGRFDEHGQLIVSQARLTWAFARAHRLGYGSPVNDYLAAAAHGYANLTGIFSDPVHGGLAWRTRDGRVSDANKVLYGASFALYAIVEYAVAAGDRSALEFALALFQQLEGHRPIGEAASGGPIELAGPSFGPLLPSTRAIDDRYTGVAAVGYRCANTSLHWMEALTELYRATADAAVGRALALSLEVNARDFYPRDLARGHYFVPLADGTPPWPKRVDLSYGHNVEFGWLMIAGQQVLGIEPDWPRLESIVGHTLRFGVDHHRGGVFNAGRGDAPAHDRRKTWWQQAEMIAALTYLEASGAASRSYAGELEQCLDWYFGPQLDPTTGNPYCMVAEDGEILDATISGEWQAAYHDLRARWIFIAATSAVDGRVDATA